MQRYDGFYPRGSMTKKIAQVVVGLPIEGPFDYFLPVPLRSSVVVGVRVRVPFGNRQLIGYVVGLAQKSTFKKLKPVFEVLDKKAVLGPNLLKLTRELADYYGCSWGESIEASLPAALRKGKIIEWSEEKFPTPKSAPEPEKILIHDQTRQKGLPFVIDRIKESMAKGQGVLFLVPEVAQIDYIREVCAGNLTDFFLSNIYSQESQSANLRRKEKVVLPSSMNIVQEKVSNEEPVILDKRLSHGQELKTWIKIKEGSAKIVIGTRSALFAPVKNLGLMIVYEEDNSAYKQEQSPFYHARDLALMRSRTDKCSLIFISATPSVEVWSLAHQKKMGLQIFLQENPSEVQIVNLLNYKSYKSAFLSVPLRESMEKVLAQGGRTVLFMNRKGFSTSTRCNNCGHTLKCERCDINLTYLYTKKKLVCRYCNFRQTPPSVCPNCKSSYLRYTGMGIEKLESEVARFYPQARVSHFDRETKEIPADSNVIIATQAILKKERELAVDLVGILDFDNALNHLDFRSGERAFSLLMRLRTLAQKKFIVQTRLLENYCLKAFKDNDFEKFYREELKLRKELKLPPFAHLISVMLRGPKEAVAFEQTDNLYKKMTEAIAIKDIEILEPQPDVIPKLRGKYRFTIPVKTKAVKKIMPFIKDVLKLFPKKSGVVISVDVAG